MSATARFTAWAERDDNELGRWLRHPVESTRWHVANTLSELGAVLSRLGHRIHRDIPSDYFAGYYDGQQMTALTTAVVRPTTSREDMRRFLAAHDMPTDDATLDRLGWEATA